MSRGCAGLLSLCVLAASIGGTGCGAYVVDGGLYPLPTIHLIVALPSSVGLAYEDVRLSAGNGQPMYAWFIPASNARATVVVHHGALVNRSSGLTYASLFHDLDCNVFLYDYQGFGESWSLATLDTLLPDADVALAYIQARDQPNAPPVILFGASLGTLPTFAQAARSPVGVAAVVAEGSCVPQDLPTNTLFYLGLNPGPEAFLNVPHYLDPDVNVPLITLPKLFIHSRGDTTTPFAGAQQLYAEAVEPKEFQEVPGDHLQAVSVDSQHYRAIWAEFLDDVLGGQAP
ncbi:MAG TPA: alpha/beta hydrolase [Phycisphaerae bacterium]|nr:alpha/beta hydrolase [Phycisphaerae bacterium]